MTVEVRTDDPDLRFAPGAVLRTEPAERGPLTVVGRRWNGEVLLLAVETPSGPLAGREDAEQLRNTELLVSVADLPALEDPDSFYDHQLVGLTARLPDGAEIGTVTAVRHDGGDLLVVRRTDGGGESPEALIPFVSAIVPTVDLDGGVVVVDPPEGLLEL